LGIDAAGRAPGYAAPDVGMGVLAVPLPGSRPCRRFETVTHDVRRPGGA